MTELCELTGMQDLLKEDSMVEAKLEDRSVLALFFQLTYNVHKYIPSSRLGMSTEQILMVAEEDGVR